MIGLDEVGRGAWAGPLLVVAARIKSGKKLPTGVNDSKKLSKKRREQLYGEIVTVCDIGEGWISSDIVDELGLTTALTMAFSNAAKMLSPSTDEEIIVDGNYNFLKELGYSRVRTEVGADGSVAVVSAASIAAKVLRDRRMAEYSKEFPGYAFERNVGYGTKLHMTGLSQFGPSTIHRMSYKPVAECARQP